MAQDIDMATLAQLLGGISQGRWTDQTPFGMWGVRDMDPNKLGGLINTAAEINQRRMGAQEAADAQRRASMNHLAGTMDTNDVNYDLGWMGLAGKEADMERRWSADQLRSNTELAKQGLENKGRAETAGIMANPKSMMKVPDQLWMMIYQTLQNKKATPEQMQAIQEIINMARSTDQPAAMQKVLDTRQKGSGSKTTAEDNRTWSLPSPEIRPDSLLSQMRRPDMGYRWAAEDMLP